MLDNNEKESAIKQLLVTEGYQPSTLRRLLQTDADYTPMRFADKPGFDCPAVLQEELSYSFSDGSSSISDGAWVTYVKTQITAEIENDIITSSAKTSEERINETVKLGTIRIAEFFEMFKTNVTTQAKAFNEEKISTDDIKLKLSEATRKSFSRSKCLVALKQIQDFYHHIFDQQQTKDLAESHIAKESKTVVGALNQVLSALPEVSPFLEIAAETAKILGKHKPNEKTDIMLVALGKSLFDTCTQLQKSLNPTEAFKQWVSVLRGIKNATKPMRKKLFKNPDGCGEFSNAIKNLLKTFHPDYKKVKSKVPALEPLKKMKSQRHLVCTKSQTL